MDRPYTRREIDGTPHTISFLTRKQKPNSEQFSTFLLSWVENKVPIHIHSFLPSARRVRRVLIMKWRPSVRPSVCPAVCPCWVYTSVQAPAFIYILESITTERSNTNHKEFFEWTIFWRKNGIFMRFEKNFVIDFFPRKHGLTRGLGIPSAR